MTSVVVSDGGGNIVEYVTVVEDSQQVSQQRCKVSGSKVEKSELSWALSCINACRLASYQKAI